jgi:enamine deaminase RidA (YjgF/YER057c/UK114 family)
MPRQRISTGSPFEEAAGYSRAVVDGDFCFVAGTTGYDYATMQMPPDVAEQTRNCFRTIDWRAAPGRLRDDDIALNRSPVGNPRMGSG